MRRNVEKIKKLISKTIYTVTFIYQVEQENAEFRMGGKLIGQLVNSNFGFTDKEVGKCRKKNGCLLLRFF